MDHHLSEFKPGSRGNGEKYQANNNETARIARKQSGMDGARRGQFFGSRATQGFCHRGVDLIVATAFLANNKRRFPG